MTRQLFLHKDGETTTWSTGSAHFASDYIWNSQQLPVAVRCRLGSSEEDDFALLDTGAAWCIIDDETAELLQDDLGPHGETITVKSRLGDYSGPLCQLKFCLRADPAMGTDLVAEGTFAVLHNWPGPTVLGFHGCLERVRLALDPGTRPGEEIVYFGPTG
jgi:hypothetical protein